MGLMSALAMLGSAAGGYVQGANQLKQQQRQDALDARQKVLQGREDQKYADDNADDQAMRNAFTPVAPDAATVPVPIGSRDEPQAPEDRGIRVAGQPYSDMPAAQAAAVTYNGEPARMQRAMAAVKNPMLASKLGADLLTAQTGQMQLRNAQRAEAKQVFDDGLRASTRAPGVLPQDGMAEFMSNSHADGKQGALKFRAVTDQDGSWQMMQTTPDGKQVPFGPKYQSGMDGIARAAYQLSEVVSPEAKLVHALQERKAAKEDKVADADVLLKGAQANFYNEKPGLMQSAIDAKLDAAALKAAGKTGVGKMDPDDQAEWKNLADEHREITKQMNAGAIAALALDSSGKSFSAGNPAYDRMAEQQSTLATKQKNLLAKYRDGDKPKTDKFGIRDPATKITPEQQGARDAKAGRLMIDNEYGGDLTRAKSGLIEMQDAVRKAPKTTASNEATAHLRDQIAILQKGIDVAAADKADKPPTKLLKREAPAGPMAAKAAAAAPPSSKAQVESATVPAPTGPMQARARRFAATTPAGSSEGTALDAARVATKAAQTTLLGFGSAQRARDPGGYAVAQQAYDKAKAAEDTALSAYTATAAQAMPAGRMVRPARP